MPYVNIKITREGGPDNTGATKQQKAELIQGVTQVLKDVLDKDPATTFVVVDEVSLENWGIGGMPVTEYRESVK
ncbi:MAG: 4-oxalocrotonate tautomerase family protein [Kangiellaceae bacterium]